jgi:chromosome segregation ATPase
MTTKRPPHSGTMNGLRRSSAGEHKAAQLNGSDKVTGGPSPLSAYEAASSEAFEAAVDQLLALLQPLPFADSSERQRTEAGVRAAFANAEYSTMQAAEALWSEAQRDLNGKLKAQTLQMNLKLERARTASKVEKQQVAVVLAEEHTKAREEEERQRLERERTGGNPRLTEAHQQINDLTLELEALRSAKKELETTLSQMELSVYQAQVKANRLEQSNKSLLEDNNAWMADGKEAKAALGQVQATLDAASGDRERMMARISELVQQRDELSASLKAATADLEGASAAQAEAVRLAVASATARLASTEVPQGMRLASTEAELRANEADLHTLRASLADDGGNQALKLLELRREAEEHQRQLKQAASAAAMQHEQSALLSARLIELTTALDEAMERERRIEHAREQAEQSWAARVLQAEQQLGVAQVELDAVREVAHQFSSADVGVNHWRAEAERRQQTINMVEAALATARAKLEMVQNKPLGEQVHELIERYRRAERTLDAARLELARTSRAMEYAFSELEFVLEAADSRVRQVRERAKQQKAQLVRTALESITQLRSYLTEAISGLRGPPLQGKQGNQMPLQVADRTDERLEFRQWRHRWGTTFRRDAGDLLSESGFGAPPLPAQGSEATGTGPRGSPQTGGALGGGVSQIVLKKHAPGVACAEQHGAVPGTPQPPRHPRPGGRAIPRSAPGARSVALSVAPPGGTAIPLSFASPAQARSPRQPSTAHALEEPFGSWPTDGAPATAPWQHQQHRLAQQQQQLGRLEEQEQQLQLEQQLEQLQQRLVKQQLDDFHQSKAAAAAAQPTALPHSLHYLLPGGERFTYRGVALESRPVLARANTPELETPHTHMHVPGPAPPSSPESVPVGETPQPTG